MLTDQVFSLPPSERKAIRTLAFALDRFEAFPGLLIPAPTMNALLDSGYAESGESDRPAISEIGHRLTDRGWEAARTVWGRRSRKHSGSF